MTAFCSIVLASCKPAVGTASVHVRLWTDLLVPSFTLVAFELDL